ncbi:MAG: glutathione S-transferase family protein [Proteobacteria bacterium]|nr:glutathione S-transferase family protein [Pseudomonadota bacterium]
MKLYMHPVSTTSRAVMMFVADEGIAVEMQAVDILKGEQYQPPFIAVNPNSMIPVLEDGDFRLTESSAILKYLADKAGSAAYPKDLKQRAKINEVMDWFNSNLYRDFGYGLVYPQLFPHLKRSSDEVHAATVKWGKEKSEGWLKALNDYWIGPKRNYLCGDRVTIADYFGTAFTTIGELIHCDLSRYPNVVRWLDTMKKRPGYAKTYEVFIGFAASTQGQAFQHI